MPTLPKNIRNQTIKHHLDNLTVKLSECQKIHSDGLSVLSEVEHDDPAIVHIWQVLSANTELLCSMAAVCSNTGLIVISLAMECEKWCM